MREKPIHGRRELLRKVGGASGGLLVGTGTVGALGEDLIPVPAGVEVPESQVRKVPSEEPPVDMDARREWLREQRTSDTSDERTRTRKNVEDPFPGSDSNKYLSYARDEFFTGKYVAMDATFTVPSEPPAGSNAEDSIMYYFPALINCDHDCYTTPECIMQPVLQWNQENTDYDYDWSIASWTGCGSDAGNYDHSTPISASEGDEIYGSMYIDGSRWYIHTENVTRGAYTSKYSPSEFTNYAWDRAYCTLESFYWEDGKCNHLPGDVTFSNVYLENGNGNKAQPNWGENTKNVGCSLGCNVRSYDEIHIETPN